MTMGMLLFMIAAIGALLLYLGIKGKMLALTLIGLLLMLVGGYGVGVQFL